MARLTNFAKMAGLAKLAKLDAVDSLAGWPWPGGQDFKTFAYMYFNSSFDLSYSIPSAMYPLLEPEDHK